MPGEEWGKLANWMDDVGGRVKHMFSDHAGGAAAGTSAASAQSAPLAINDPLASRHRWQLALLVSVIAPLAATLVSDKSAMGAIEKAIRDSDLGVNPTNDGAIIRVVFPQLTEERRKEFIKVAHKKAEDARISIRNVRRHAKDAIEKAVKDGEVGEDEGTRAEKELEVLTKKHVDAIDDALKLKEVELLEV